MFPAPRELERKPIKMVLVVLVVAATVIGFSSTPYLFTC